MSTETSTRPFQVGDRVRITDHNRRIVEPGRQYVFEGIVERIDPPSDPESEHEFGPYLWIDTAPFDGGSGKTHTATFCPLTDDMAAATYPDFDRSIELLEPAPADPPTTAPQDHGPLAAPLSDRTLAKVLSRPAHVPAGAEPEPFSVEGMVITNGWLAEQVGECTCGGVDQYGHECHERGCGLEPVARLDDLPGWPRTSRPTTDEAVAAIKKRLQWASIHWGTQKVSEDAWPHIADAVLSLWGPEKAS